jgi:hypothetical protein
MEELVELRTDVKENQCDGVQSIWNMLRNQQPGPSQQQPDPSTTFWNEDNFFEDSSTKGEKVGEGDKDKWKSWRRGQGQMGSLGTNEVIPVRQYWIEDMY